MMNADEAKTALYEKILRLHPELWQVSQLTLKARERLKYPLRDYDDFLSLANQPGRDTWKLDGIQITLAQAKRYFSPTLFPIEDEDDFIGKLLGALLWGRRAHAMEEELSRRKATKHSLTRARVMKGVRDAK
jgi:hypothetical protein